MSMREIKCGECGVITFGNYILNYLSEVWDMTTRITVKNEGPDCLLVRFYKEDRQFADEKIVLNVGESTDITVWDGHLPVMWPTGANSKGAVGNTFHSVPPATY